MNGRERFLTALDGGIPDRIPLFETHFGLPFIREVLGAGVCPYHNVDDEVKLSHLTGSSSKYGENELECRHRASDLRRRR